MKRINKLHLEIKKDKVVFLALCLFLVTIFFELVIFSFGKVGGFFDNIVRQEQIESYDKIAKNISESENSLNILQSELEEIKKIDKLSIDEESRSELLDTLNLVENDFLKIENGIKSYRNDMSIQFYSRKDKIIEEKIDNAWGLIILTNRLVRNIENIALINELSDYQIKIAEENLRRVLDKFEKIK